MQNVPMEGTRRILTVARSAGLLARLGCRAPPAAVAWWTDRRWQSTVNPPGHSGQGGTVSSCPLPAIHTPRQTQAHAYRCKLQVALMRRFELGGLEIHPGSTHSEGPSAVNLLYGSDCSMISGPDQQAPIMCAGWGQSSPGQTKKGEPVMTNLADRPRRQANRWSCKQGSSIP